MTISREPSPIPLFLRMVCGIALTSIGPVLLILVLIVHIKIGNRDLAGSAQDVLRVRMIAFSTIMAGLPIWFFTQLRLARGIRDGEWSGAELKRIRRIVFACPIRPLGILTLMVYAIGIGLRGRFYWLVGFGTLIFPLGAFSDLYKQFTIRDLSNEFIDGDTSAVQQVSRPPI